MDVSVIANIAWNFAKRYRITLLVWSLVVLFGALSYTMFLNREGFPSVNLPIASVQGTYFVDDETEVDQEVVIPITNALSSVDSIEKFQASARPNNFNIVIFFSDDVSADEGASEVAQAISSLDDLPAQLNLAVTPIEPALFNGEYNLIAAVYDEPNTSYESLQEKAQTVAVELSALEEVSSAASVEVIEQAQDPSTQEAVSQQVSINRVGVRESNEVLLYRAASVGVVAENGVDDLALSDAVAEGLQNIDIGSYKTTITADFATTIRQQINSLQSNLLGGLIAVVIVALLLISWRAAVVIALFIPTVLAATFLGMQMFGFTLNTITLFAVILTLGLFVDDATIIVEALDAGRKKGKSHKEIIKRSISRVGIASLAGTLTTVLVFTPMLFVSGVLGSFIKLLPLTVILALIFSFTISVVLVPLLSRIMVLSSWSDVPLLKRLSLLLPLEEKIGTFVSKLPTLPKDNSRVKRTFMHIGLFSLSIVLIATGGVFAGLLKFDIFPQPKDGDRLQAIVNFQPGTDIDRAETVTKNFDDIVKNTIGEDLVYVTYIEANNRGAIIEIGLSSFKERATTSVQYVDALQEASGNLEGGSSQISQLSAGPPTADFPFQMRIYSSDEQNARSVGNEIVGFLSNKQLKLNGKEATVAEVKIQETGGVNRSEKGRFITLLARVDNTDLNSAAVLEIEEIVMQEFNEQKLSSYGLNESQLDFDVSQESENADSFSAIGIGLAVAIFLMYIVLVLLFNSLLQPLLILMAVPFSLFGVFVGLYLTDNPMSFFVMLAILGLVGIVVNNSILLTEYANQEKSKGADNRTAISRAVKDRFRPLIVTTTTTVFALLPLALSDPFWQALAYTLIFGIVSSTFLIILSFPYYYLAVEWLRDKKNRRFPGLK